MVHWPGFVSFESKLLAMDRRDFLHTSGLLAGALATENIFASSSQNTTVKKRVAMVGTGSRGIGMWGRPVIKEFGDQLEFVGLCDINPGRVDYAKKILGLSCPTFTDFDKMMKETKPEQVLVMTVDGTHHEYIIKSMEYGADVITEKPMTI